MAKDSIDVRSGSPVFNNCGELLGIIDPKSGVILPLLLDWRQFKR